MAKANLKSLEIREALVKKLGKKYVPGYQDFMIMELTTDIAPLAAYFDNNMNKALVAMTEANANGYFNMKDKYVFVSEGSMYSIKAKEYKKYIDFCYDIISDRLIADELKVEIETKELSLDTFGLRNVRKKMKNEEVTSDDAIAENEIETDYDSDSDKVIYDYDNENENEDDNVDYGGR